MIFLVTRIEAGSSYQRRQIEEVPAFLRFAVSNGSAINKGS